MAARRTGVPVSWTSTQELRPEEGRILYLHVGGVTRGMRVEWQLERCDRGVQARILHDLRYLRPWLRFPLARWVTGRVFVSHVADRTLRGLKREAEQAPH